MSKFKFKPGDKVKINKDDKSIWNDSHGVALSTYTIKSTRKNGKHNQYTLVEQECIFSGHYGYDESWFELVPKSDDLNLAVWDRI